MPHSIEYNKSNKCIEVCVVGELDLDLFQKFAFDVAKTSADTGCTKILNNLREAWPVDNVLEIMKMPNLAKIIGVTPKCKRALVVGDKVKEFYFLETVFVNQGHVVKMFSTIEEAKEWLFS